MNNYPFLVHSQESLSQQTAPNVDNQRLVRQKRRRTSPEDQAILEAEFDQNPKPDKATRMEIVKKVALGEKEVQIWFQNRRQVTRRRSRPLLPHEILANLRTMSQSSERVPSFSSSRDEGSQQCLSSSQSSIPIPQSQSFTVENEPSQGTSQVTNTYEHELSCEADTSIAGMSTANVAGEASQKCDTEAQKACLNDLTADSREAGRSGGLLRSLSQAMSNRRKPESLGKRRNASFIIHDEENHMIRQSANDQPANDVEKGPISGNSTAPSRALRRTSSLVRLSMSLEGKAQVTTSTGTTPSPPRPQPVLYPDSVRRPSSGLQRSFSAVEPIRCDSITNTSLRRPTTGRSRDSRTWEFYCDKDARDALTEQAEREESGSATAVIALIKSNSNMSKAATSKSNKRNAHYYKAETAKRLKAAEGTGQRLKLSRSQSSLANMQTLSGTVSSKTENIGGAHYKELSKSVLIEPNEGDSDKENWVPGTQQRSPLRRRPADSSYSQRRVLEESQRHSSGLGALSQEREYLRKVSSLKAASDSTSSSMSEKENMDSDGIDGISFEGDKTPPREADDLDCVQNLLSLSQAAWQ